MLGSNIKGYAGHSMIQPHHVCKAKTITDGGYPLAYYIKILSQSIQREKCIKIRGKIKYIFQI